MIDASVALAWVLPAQATKRRSGFLSSACCANGVKSLASCDTSNWSTVAPSGPKTALTAATFPCPNAVSCAKTRIVLPLGSARKDFAVRVSWYDCRPERKV